ncbi:MAG: alpha-1,2-fucosyltransferase, partial [Rhabdaerophilum sp.]
ESYYRDAIRFVQDLVPQARFFIASDDVTTAQDFAATLPGAQVLRGQKAGDDLYLMSRCRHHIIANSSFSWWSAWLDRRPGGFRIAPKAWFGQDAALDASDLFPEGWVRL